MGLRYTILLMVGLLVSRLVFPQQTYEMGNQSVNDCTGTLTDSEDGTITGHYDNNENFVFTICVPGAASITMRIPSLRTEANADTLSFYDGNSTAASSLGAYHGIHNNLTITSTGNCLTIKFVSDGSLTNTGWEATWESIITTVPMPNINSIVNPSCNSTSIDIKIDQKFNCDSIDDGNFKLFGPNAPGVSSVSALNCDGNNESDSFRINFTAGLSRSGTYTLPFETRFIDACDSVWILLDTLAFSVTDCPIEVDLSVTNSPICRGSCTDIEAIITGGDSTNYIYSWTPSSITGAPPQTVCPNATTTYYLTVSDGTSVPGTDSVQVVVLDPPVAQNDTTICISSMPFALSATPGGGAWSGRGITNSTTGMFDPAVAGGGVTWIYYTISGCTDSIRVSVRNVWAGFPEAACPGSAPFQLWGFPAGGTWSGIGVTPGGMFTPPATSGSVTVTYTWNGCSASKTIEVGDIQFTLKPDSMCRSEDSVNLQATPAGGRWSGPGITNTIRGTFKPLNAGVGLKNIRYTVNGCVYDTWIYVKNVNARWNEVFCPDEGIVTFPAGLPAGGMWSGAGIVDPSLGTWDINYRTFPWWGYNDTAWYTYQGCTDEKLIYIRPTRVIDDSLSMCIEAPRLLLNWTAVRRTPGGGTWAGPGVTSNGWFTPSDAGYGLHTLYYTVNTCTDSLRILIFPQSIIQQDTTFCITEPDYTLFKGQAGGTWTGRGIVNANQGVFRPSAAGIGVHKIYYTSVNGCLDSLEITVNPRPTVTLNAIDPYYCFKDTNINLTFNPAGGVWSGTPLNGNVFNPAMAGTGPVSITYTYGTPQCQRSRTITSLVGDTLFVSIQQDKDSICPGEGVNLVPTAIRGNGGGYTYNWDNGRNTAKDIFELPVSDAKYVLEVNDGCSNPAFDTAYVGIHPAVSGQFSTSEIQCFGETGWAKVVASPPSPNYIYQWNTNPVSVQDSINATVGIRYRVNIVNSQTGCFWDGSVLIPGYSRIRASFTTFPRVPSCINNLNPAINLIDFSDGGVTGYWDMGDGTRIPYVSGQNPSHDYSADTNSYNIKLYIENEGGCSDSAEFPVCMVDTVLIFVPNAFTPGKVDGINDVFVPVVNGTTEYSLEIFNRWGEKVFETNNPQEAWDGKVREKAVPSDYYHYLIKYKGKQTARKVLGGVVFVLW